MRLGSKSLASGSTSGLFTVRRYVLLTGEASARSIRLSSMSSMFIWLNGEPAPAGM
ncbi:hypothetical protein D3C87_948470 [compost metagenome]